MCEDSYGEEVWCCFLGCGVEDFLRLAQLDLGAELEDACEGFVGGAERGGVVVEDGRVLTLVEGGVDV